MNRKQVRQNEIEKRKKMFKFHRRNAVIKFIDAVIAGLMATAEDGDKVNI